MQPKVVDWYTLAVLGGVCPLASMLVLRVFPFWSDSLLEQVVISLGWKFGGRSDVVLSGVSNGALMWLI
jgi:hypothetical protein